MQHCFAENMVDRELYIIVIVIGETQIRKTLLFEDSFNMTSAKITLIRDAPVLSISYIISDQTPLTEMYYNDQLYTQSH